MRARSTRPRHRPFGTAESGEPGSQITVQGTETLDPPGEAAAANRAAAEAAIAAQRHARRRRGGYTAAGVAGGILLVIGLAAAFGAFR